MAARQSSPAPTVAAPDLVTLTAGIVSAYVDRHQLPIAEVTRAIHEVHGALLAISRGDVVASEPRSPAVPVKKSVTDDYLVCLEDGKRLRMLKRYIKTHYDLTPEQYRRKWNLPPTYPMVAPSYARMRATFAKQIGLGRVVDSRRRRA